MSFAGNVTLTNPIGFLTPIGPRKINTVPLDVVIDETISHSVVVTEHPIEITTASGVARGTVADNAFVAPSVYTMRGAVSDLPISWRVFRSDPINDNGDTLQSYANSHQTTRSLSAYEILFKEHFLKLKPFTLVTPFGDLENMLFRTFRINRDASTKDAIVFEAEFYQLQTVETVSESPAKTEDIMSGDQAQTQAVDELDRGEVAPIEVP